MATPRHSIDEPLQNCNGRYERPDLVWTCPKNADYDYIRPLGTVERTGHNTWPESYADWHNSEVLWGCQQACVHD